MSRPKLLLDENIGVLVAQMLAGSGYDCLSIIKERPGTSDKSVLELARKDSRIVVTLDKDFGRLVYQYSQKHTGVVLLRLKDESAKKFGEKLLTVLELYGDKLTNRFTVITDTKLRF